MDTAAYAKRLYEAQDSIKQAIKRFSQAKGFEDLDALMIATTHRDPQIQRLFETEALAGLITRLADAYAPAALPEPAEQLAEPALAEPALAESSKPQAVHRRTKG